jgi:hypothetical protein
VLGLYSTARPVVDCFYCDSTPAGSDPLEHLAREHADKVETELDEATRKLRVRILCPYCPFSLRTEIGSHPDMHAMEIALPAFTMLISHLANDHEPPLTEGD